jgi:hypothetical protein
MRCPHTRATGASDDGGGDPHTFAIRSLRAVSKEKTLREGRRLRIECMLSSVFTTPSSFHIYGLTVLSESADQ